MPILAPDPRHAEQDRYEECVAKGGKSISKWAQEWRVDEKTARDRLSRLYKNGDAICCGLFFQGFQRRTKMWIVKKCTILLEKPKGLFTISELAALWKMGIGSAGRLCKMLSGRSTFRASEFFLHAPGSTSRSQRLYPLPTDEQFRQMGRVPRLLEFPRGGFDIVAAQNFWGLSYEAARSRVKYGRRVGKFERLGVLANRAASDRKGNRHYIYRFTKKGKP